MLQVFLFTQPYWVYVCLASVMTATEILLLLPLEADKRGKDKDIVPLSSASYNNLCWFSFPLGKNIIKT